MVLHSVVWVTGFIWVTGLLFGVFHHVLSLPSVDSNNDYLIETEEELDIFLGSELREYRVHLEKAAMEIKDNHHRSYDTSYQRKRRSNSVNDVTYPHAFTYDTGVDNRQALKVTGVTHFQEFNLKSANDWEYFQQDNLHVLVLASQTVAESGLYVFNEETQEFGKFSSFSSDTGVLDIEVYSIGASAYGGEGRYIAAVKTSGQVTVYQIMEDLTITEKQSIDDGITKQIKSFNIETNTYLGLAVNQNHHGNTQCQSTIYQWHARSQQFIHMQDIRTYGAVDIENFEISRNSYLVIANSVDNAGSTKVFSVVYKYDHYQRYFRLYQRIHTNDAKDVEYFSLGFQHYLVVSNFGSGQSTIYKWDGLNFVEFQDIPGTSPVSWHAIPVGSCGETVLLVHLSQSPGENNVNVYTYSGMDKQFIKVNQTFYADGHQYSSFTSFTLEGKIYLVKADVNGGVKNYIDRIDYLIEDVPNPVTVQYQTLVAEIEKIKKRLHDYESAVVRAQSLLDDGMTVDGEQTITGHKIFQNNVTMEDTLFGNTIIVEGKLNLDDAIETIDIGSEISNTDLLADLQSQSSGLTRIQEMLEDAVTLNSNQHITGSKTVTSMTFEGAVRVQTLTVSEVNGVDVNKLNTEGVRLNDQRAILGKKTLTKDVTVNGDVDMQPLMLVNNIDLSEDVLFTDQQLTTISGLKQFETSTHTVIDGSADFESSVTVNGIQIDEEAVLLHTHNEITGHKVFEDMEIASDLIVTGRVDGVDISHLFADAVLVHGDQTISGTKSFTQSLAVNGSFRVDGLINGVDLSYIDQAAAKIHDDFLISGKTVFEDPVTIDNLIVDGLVDGMDISEDLLRSSGNQEITGAKTFTAVLTLEDTADVNHLVDGIDLSNVVTLTGQQNITGYLMFGNGIATENDVTVEETVDGVKVSNLHQIIVTKSTDQVIPYDVVFGSPAVVEGDIVTMGTVNGLEFDELFKDAVIQNSQQTQEITGKKTFGGDMTVAEGKGFINVEGLLNNKDYVASLLMKYGDQNIMGKYTFLNGFTAKRDITVGGLVDGVDLDQLVSELVDISSDQSIAGHKTFTGSVSVQSLVDVTGTTDNVDLSEQLKMINKQQLITGEVTFANAVIQKDLSVHGNTTVTRTIDGVILEDFDSERITLSTDQVIDGDVIVLDTVHVDGHISVFGTLNGITLEDVAVTAISLTKDQTITSAKTFTSTVDVTSDIVTDRMVDGVDLSQLASDALYTSGSQIVTGRKQFADNVVIMNNLIVDGKIDGVDVELLSSDVVCTDQPQTITANKTFSSGFLVQGDITVAGKVNSLDISEQLLRKSTRQTITGSYVFKSVTVNGNVTVTGTVNSVDISQLDNTVVKTNVQQTINGDIQFNNDVNVDNNVIINGKLDGVDVAALYVNTAQINKDGYIESDVIFEGALHIRGDMNVDGLVNGKDLSEFNDIVVTLDGNQDIIGEKTFEDSIIVRHDVQFNDLTVHGLIDGVDFNEVLKDVAYLDSNEMQNFTGTNTFNSMNINGNIVSHGLIDGVNIAEQVVTLDGREDISGAKTFNGDVELNANLAVSGNVNGVDISDLADDVLTKSGNHVIRGKKTFTHDVEMLSDLRVSGTVDGVDLSEHACTLDTVQTITAIKTFQRLTDFYGNITVKGLISGYNIMAIDLTRIRLNRDAIFNGYIKFEDSVTLNGEVTVLGKVDMVNLQHLYDYVNHKSDKLRADLYEMAYIADQQCDIMEDLGQFYEETISELDYLDVYQRLPINEPRYIEIFDMDGSIYLATTTYKDDTDNLCTHSIIYELDMITAIYTERWSLLTNGAVKWHSVVVDGVQHLIVANEGQQHCAGATTHVSYVYKYDAVTQNFTKVQELKTYGARDIDTMVMYGETYLAVANTVVQPGGVGVESFLFKYSSVAKQFELVQALPTGSVSIVEFITENHNYFVVFAQRDLTHNKATIYHHNNGLFEYLQELGTHHTKGISHFPRENTHVLVMAEEEIVGQYDNTHKTTINLYEWAASTQQFRKFEQFSVADVSSMKVIQIGGYFYLLTASTSLEQLTLYKYTGSQGWTEMLYLTVENVFGLETFEHNGETYIVLVTNTGAVVYHAVKLGENVSMNSMLCDHNLLEESWHGDKLP